MSGPGGWEEVTDPAEIRKVTGKSTLPAVGGPVPLTKAAEARLNELSGFAMAAGDTGRIYERANKYIKTLQPGPYRGAFLDAAIPQEGGGILDKVGAVVVGGPARLIGAITGKEIDAYQGLKALQSENVLGKQLLQKGPQTESDAARLQLTEISPSKSAAVNRAVIANGLQKSRRDQAKAIFYTHFANTWGLNGRSPHGFTADQMWARMGDQLTDKYLPRGKSQAAPARVRVISRRKVR